MTPTSGTGAEGSRGTPLRRAGFTLVELLLVLTVMSLAAAAVVLTMPDPKPTLAVEAERLAARLQRAQDAAIVEGRPMAVAIDARGYSFSERSQGLWRPLGKPPFSATPWEEDTRLLLDSEEPALRVTFDPTGATDPVRLRLQRGGERRAVEIDAAGQVRLADAQP